MKVATVWFDVYYLAEIDGKFKKVTADWFIGGWETVWGIKSKYGTEINQRDIYRKEVIFAPAKFPGEKSEDYYKAYLNWVLNRPNKSEAQFFDSAPDRDKYFQNNPVTKIMMCVSRRPSH